MAQNEKALRLFATPVIVGSVDGADALNGELEAAIREQMKSTESVKKSNVGGWHSKTDFLDWSGDAGRRVAEAAIELANAHTVHISGKPVRQQWRVSAWANVSGPRDSHATHVHPAAYWSVVYFVRVGGPSGGSLVLNDPRMPALRMHAPWLLFKDAGPEAMAKIKPVEGQIVLFPSWLSHSVDPWEGEGERISIALNLTAPMPPPANAGRKPPQQAKKTGKQ
jgi:uncharacterized protein (TIGR02466 family)